MCVHSILESTKAWTSQAFVIRDVGLLGSAFRGAGRGHRLPEVAVIQTQRCTLHALTKAPATVPISLETGLSWTHPHPPSLSWVNPSNKQSPDKQTEPAISLAVFPSDYGSELGFIHGGIEECRKHKLILDMKSSQFKSSWEEQLQNVADWEWWFSCQLTDSRSTAKWTNPLCVLGNVTSVNVSHRWWFVNGQKWRKSTLATSKNSAESGRRHWFHPVLSERFPVFIFSPVGVSPQR